MLLLTLLISGCLSGGSGPMNEKLLDFGAVRVDLCVHKESTHIK